MKRLNRSLLAAGLMLVAFLVANLLSLSYQKGHEYRCEQQVTVCTMDHKPQGSLFQYGHNGRIPEREEPEVQGR